MEYQATEETVNGRKVVTVYYDREKDDFLEAMAWSLLNFRDGLTIIFQPKKGW